ncbi:MAG TPA: hypothetical protein ENN17_09020 [bacterium]|nr:hypothetical protein [bacterium]
MLKKNRTVRLLLPAMGFILLTGGLRTSAQEMRWLRVGETQCFFLDIGAETELYNAVNTLTWPTLYGDNQYTMRAKGLWLGARDFDDPVENVKKSVKVIGVGPRLSANQFNMIFPESIRLIARYPHPAVIVDEEPGTNNTLYDVPDDYDEELPCDRMIEIRFNTSLGVSVTKKVMAFTQQNHGNYFIHDYVFKNTGIIDAGGTVHEQTLNDFWMYHNWRVALSGVTSTGWGSTWGAFSSEWGASTLFRTLGTPPDNTQQEIKGFYAWYGPQSDRPVTFEEDWGCPNHMEDNGVLGSAKYVGVVTLHADRSPRDPSNDPNQPRTNAYVAADHSTMEANVSQFDEDFMGQRWRWMTEGYLPQSLVDEVGEGKYVSDLSTTNPDRNSGGGSSQGLGFGPYTLAPGDSIRIVFAEGINGIGWPKCREVGGNWFAYYKGTGAPTLINPDGTPAVNHNAYKRAWCETGADSIVQTLRNALSNFNSGYAIPRPPPAPEWFTVQSGGDRIRLTWAENAAGHAHFNGYVIYRSEGNVKDYRTVYRKVFECDASDAVHTWDDVSAVRGFNYYYYIQSKDDGSQNDVHPGKPLYSSAFLTLTSVEAYLRRPQGLMIEEVRVVPNPYDIRSRRYQFGDKSQYDRIVFYELPGVCKLRVYTERGDLIWEKDHTDGSGDEIWDSMTRSRQIVVSGIYILHVEVTEDIYAEDDIFARRDFYGDPRVQRTFESGQYNYIPDGEPIYRTGDLMFQRGDRVYRKGESVFRKFVIIR